MPAKQVPSADLIRDYRNDEFKRLQSQYEAVLNALIKAEGDRDRFFEMKRSLAGVYADERNQRQTIEAALIKIQKISGNLVPDKTDKQGYENGMDEIFQHCISVTDPIEDEE